jgi:DNA-binding LacI/PurR family transcriptional regulator
MPNRSRSVGLVEVARLAGVSPSTVSGVFRDASETYSVSPATRAKVMEAATRLGYRPNSLARAMRRRRFQQIGFLVRQPERTIRLVPETMAGVFDAATAAGYHLMFIAMDPRFTREGHVLPQSFQEECIDCLVADGTLTSVRDVAQMLKGARFPVVHMNMNHAFNSVHVDDTAAAREATAYLLAKGHRRVVFFNYQRASHDSHYSFQARRSAYFEVMAEAGLAAREISLPVDADWMQATEAQLQGDRRADALLCYNDEDAIMVQRVTARLGLRVPADIEIVGFNGALATGFSPNPITTMQIPWYDMGRAAAEMALALSLDTTVTELPSRMFKAKLVEGVFGVGAVL